jgi:hypothetical protein
MTDNESQSGKGGGLARVADFETNRLQTDLDRALEEKLMAQADLGGLLAQELASRDAGLSLPTSADIDNALGYSEIGAGEINDLLSGLSAETVNDLQLAKLLEGGGVSVEDMKTIKVGLKLLRHNRYAEAKEWWMLNTPQDSTSHFYRKVKVLLAMTYFLLGDGASAQAAIQEAKRNAGH